jgi:uncharacterized protein YeaO (DUF488 family)
MIREIAVSDRKRTIRPDDVVFEIYRSREQGRNTSPLAPSHDLMSDWNAGRAVWKEYVERYYTELRANREATSLMERMADLAAKKDVWLVGLEEGYPCPRFLVKQIIERMLVARGVLNEPEDYSAQYGACKNLTRAEILARRRIDKRK